MAGRQRKVDLVLGLLLTSVSCTGSQIPNVRPSQSATKPPAITPSAPAGPGRVAFVFKGDVWTYRQNGELKQLTKDGSYLPGRHAPQYLDAGRVAFVDGDSVNVVDVRTGAISRVYTGSGGIVAFDWNVADNAIAYIVQPNGVGAHELRMVDLRTRADRRLIRLPPPPEGENFNVAEDSRILWHVQAKRLLLVDTVVSDGPTLFVFDEDGNVLARREGATFGVWSRDGSAVYFRDYARPRWWSLRIASGELTRLNVVRGAMHPAVSPDGSRIAFDDGRALPPGSSGGCSCSVIVYDLATREEKSIAHGFVKPLWLDNDEILSTAVRRCVDGQCSYVTPMWVAEARAGILKLSGSSSTRQGIMTLDADTL